MPSTPSTPLEPAEQAQTRRRIPPHKRGGRARVAHREAQTGADRRKRVAIEFLLRRRGAAWSVCLSVAGLEGETDVQQAGVRLEGRANRYVLHRPHLPVTVTDADGRVWHAQPPDFTHPVLFRLNGRWDEGRRMRSLSQGSYAVTVPVNWVASPGTIVLERSAALGHVGAVLVCRVDPDNPLLFVRPNGATWTLSATQPRFAPVGELLEDSAEQGPLFGPDVPAIVSQHVSDWDAISVIVIGTEGRQRSWRIYHKPDPSLGTQRLPNALGRRGSGWYFVRLYDHEQELVESFAFRFVAGLRAIRCKGGDAWPGEEGHGPVCVTFASDHPLNLQAGGSYDEEVLASAPPETQLRLPAHPRSDSTSWILAARRGGPVALDCRVSRVWWRLVRPGDNQREWRDQPLQLRGDDMLATSEARVELRVCCAPTMRMGAARVLHIRLGQGPDRTYPLRWHGPLKHVSHVSVPLRDLCDDDDFAPRPGGLDLMATMDGVPGEARLAHVMLGFGCAACNFTSRDPNDLLRHLMREHRSVLFETVAYQDIARLDSSLPPKVYVCPYCGYYARPSLGSMTTDIANHIERDCEKAGSPPRSVTFRMATDIDEVRRAVIPHLPWPFKCLLCGEIVRSPSKDEIASILSSHIAEKHWFRVVRKL